MLELALMGKISCFTITNNVLSQGYPFVESIISAIPICDEFIICDGYSTDGTWETLKTLAKIYPKIKLYKDKWANKSKEGNVLSIMTNKAKERCNGKFLLYLQSNEVIHEESANRIKSLPNFHRAALELFHLPFLYIIGKDLVFGEEFRSRLVANNKEIGAINDAGHLSYYRSSINKYILKSISLDLFKTRDKLHKLFPVYEPGIDGIRRPYIHINLPKPIFRYFGIFKENFIEKMKNHKMISSNYENQYSQIINLINDRSPLDFPTLWYEFMIKYNKESYLEKPYTLEISQHPKIMQGLLKKNTNKYFVRSNLLKSQITPNDLI